LEIHGTNDETVPYNGNPALSVPIPELLEFWSMNNSCASTPVEEELSNTNTSDSSTVTRISYPDCEGGLEVLHFRINNGAHTWPGSPIPIGGVTNQDIVASDEIWSFFQQFTIDGTVNSTDAAVSVDWRIFPNPVSDFLYFEGTVAPRQLRLYDLSGRVLLQQEEVEQPYLNIVGVPAGVYFLEASFDGGQRVVEKVVKKH
jgi:polyhydroxybutyrate depolymerase